MFYGFLLRRCSSDSVGFTSERGWFYKARGHGERVGRNKDLRGSSHPHWTKTLIPNLKLLIFYEKCRNHVKVKDSCTQARPILIPKAPLSLVNCGTEQIVYPPKTPFPCLISALWGGFEDREK